MERHVKHSLILWDRRSGTAQDLDLIMEEPLSIRVQGKPYAVIMRTPGDERVHVAGFCFAEGIVDRPDQIVSLALCDGSDTNVVTVTLSPDRRASIAEILDRREYISQTSCGICGKALVSDLTQAITPVGNQDLKLDAAKVLERMDEMSLHQPLRNRTRAAHTALIFNQDLNLVSSAEDVGRHNALDKAIGTLFLENRLDEAFLLIMSSRLSYELIQKASRARIPVVAAISRPTALAVNLAASLGMTLASKAKGVGLFVYSYPERLGIAGGPAA
ncbi:MAG: formate dehydrogenase accessory sulfurtransferase FdhD [Pseudomonadota bacterium]